MTRLLKVSDHKKLQSGCGCACMRTCVRAYVRACVRACARVLAGVGTMYACLCTYVCELRYINYFIVFMFACLFIYRFIEGHKNVLFALTVKPASMQTSKSYSR